MVLVPLHQDQSLYSSNSTSELTSGSSQSYPNKSSVSLSSTNPILTTLDTNTHPMTIRSKMIIFKPKTYLTQSPKHNVMKPSNVKQALLNPL